VRLSDSPAINETDTRLTANMIALMIISHRGGMPVYTI